MQLFRGQKVGATIPPDGTGTGSEPPVRQYRTEEPPTRAFAQARP
ncbi:hypothetical protein [Mobiluncus curtisii]|uniref:Uncharacterized protein n=1 Tax=Mobiluncus curtisii ATCC 51333 TaxID=887326 RepID=E6LX43_9ACTO|nr:hypothetical protein [Mobiluncus curtisii]EFU80597.1 hypothetical protein HMPREF0388_0316 [Mobiluncus curtisii ATCC 51333]